LVQIEAKIFYFCLYWNLNVIDCRMALIRHRDFTWHSQTLYWAPELLGNLGDMLCTIEDK
jgi:hypothetical protein